MDFNENSESSDNHLKIGTKDKNNSSPADLISSASEEKTPAVGFNGFGASNDKIVDCNSDGSFHSVETDEDDTSHSNIRTIHSNSNEYVGDDLKNTKASEDSSVTSQSKSTSSNLTCGEKNIETVLNDDSELLFTSGKPDNQDDPGLKFDESNTSIQQGAIEDEDAADSLNEHPKNSPANTEGHSIYHNERKNNCSNDDAVNTESSLDARTADDDFQTKNVDEADESFSLEEIVEESECSDKDEIRGNSSNDENLDLDEESVASIQAEDPEGLVRENGDDINTSGDHQFCKSPLNNELEDSTDVGDNPICQEVGKDTVTIENVDENSIENVENNSENTCNNFLPEIVPSPVSTTDNVIQQYDVDHEKSEHIVKSPSEKDSSEATAAETSDCSGVTKDITIESSPSKSQQKETSSDNHNVLSSVAPLQGDDQRSATEDSTGLENSTNVPNEDEPSSHGESVRSGESSDALSSVSNVPNGKVASPENGRTTEPSANPDQTSLMEDLAPDSTQELLSNLRRRVSSRRRNNSDGSELSLSDASLPGESDSSMLAAETCSETNNLRTPPKSTSTSPRSSSNWQPKINEVTSASGSFSICLEKFSENSLTDNDIKEEVIDESYGMDFATKERFNLVDFSIKLEKMEFDSDIEIISPRKSRPTARRSVDSNATSRLRSRSEMLRSRMRSRKTTNRSRPNSRPSSTTSSAQCSAKNRQVDVPVSTRGAARSGSKSASRVNGHVAKSATRRSPDSQRHNNTNASSKNSTRRSSRGQSEDKDRGRIDFLSIFNLRSRRESGDENVKGMLVTPRINRARAKKVSFQLPVEESASTKRNNSSSKGRNSSRASKGDDTSSKSTVKVSSSKPEDSCPKLSVQVPPLRYFEGGLSSKSPARTASRPADRKRNATAAQSNRKSAPIPVKRSRSASARAKRKSESEDEDEVIDEHLLEKLEEVVDSARKTVDVWFECQCCNQKYYLIENTKTHVRTHFPNCLTN